MYEDKKKLIEGALFVSAKWLRLEDLMKLLNINAPGFVKKLVEELKEEYKDRAMEIVEYEGRYSMQIKKDLADKLKNFAQSMELSKSALRTLAYISKHNGILKSEVVKRIGPQVYQDVKELVKSGFIKQIKAGRTKRLMLTDKFRMYFKNLKTEGQSRL